MNTNKQINIMILLVFGAIILTGAYWIIDPDRATSARQTQQESTVERGAWLFSQNCRVCHGNVGEGGAASNRLRSAPPLDRDDLQGIVDGEFSETALTQAYDLVFNTIVCGRVGRPMPTWGQSQGGTLNDEQIKQLTTFITQPREIIEPQAEGGESGGGEEGAAEPEEPFDGWRIAEEYALEGVPEFGLHSSDTQDELRLAEAIDDSATTLTLTSNVVKPVEAVGPGLRLEIDEELMLIQDVNLDTGEITVERGIGTTDPAAHEAGATVIEPPVPPDPPAITERACGQTASAQPTAAPEPPSATLSIAASGIAWTKTRLFALPDAPLTLTVDNQDEGTPHNIAFFQGAEPGGDEVEGARTEIENGPVTQTLEFGPLPEGDYYYFCEVHPNMEGVLSASAAGQAGGGDGASPDAPVDANDPVTTDTVTP